MSKLNFEMKIIIKSFYTNKIVQASRQQMNEVRNKQHNGRIKNAQNWNYHMIASCLNRWGYFIAWWQHIQVTCLSLQYMKLLCLTVGFPGLVTPTSKFCIVFTCCISLLSSTAQIWPATVVWLQRTKQLEPHQLSQIVFCTLWCIYHWWIDLWLTVRRINPMAIKQPGIHAVGMHSA